jgi:hypothetical protein
VACFQVKTLIERQLIPASLPEATDLLRELGHIGANAADSDVHPLEIQSIKSLFKAIVEFVYVYPKKIDDFKEKYQKYRYWAQNRRKVRADLEDDDSSGFDD